MPIRSLFRLALQSLMPFAFWAMASAALAQDLLYAPCLSASGDPAAVNVAFVAAGWAPVTAPADRTAALWTIGEATYMVKFLPPSPATAAELASTMADARGGGAFEFANQPLFRRGTTVAMFYFPISPDMSQLNCVFSGPAIPEVEIALVPAAGAQTIGDLHYLSRNWPNAARGVAEITIDAVRHAPAFDIDPPITGRDALFVRVKAAATP